MRSDEAGCENNAECKKERTSYYEEDHIVDIESRWPLAKGIIVYVEHFGYIEAKEQVPDIRRLSVD
jgi:hypothetical protein